ncbi:hypothetical protein K458DRAFT_432182 [Lentithecium fluviatile CBS 122367]|uniref:Uncharacterized protein n=1 Tax=Lentithecium fluviatile CBS 122367 TaxID=1168545 RepID=A0A6G1IZ48_9PLEO|nr:hypothetical protein K458DRAFT_432182 [Lentithecium fluviatile CBS 122367]
MADAAPPTSPHTSPIKSAGDPNIASSPTPAQRPGYFRHAKQEALQGIAAEIYLSPHNAKSISDKSKVQKERGKAQKKKERKRQKKTEYLAQAKEWVERRVEEKRMESMFEELGLESGANDAGGAGGKNEETTDGLECTLASANALGKRKAAQDANLLAQSYAEFFSIHSAIAPSAHSFQFQVEDQLKVQRAAAERRELTLNEHLEKKRKHGGEGMSGDRSKETKRKSQTAAVEQRGSKLEECFERRDGSSGTRTRRRGRGMWGNRKWERLALRTEIEQTAAAAAREEMQAGRGERTVPIQESGGLDSMDEVDFGMKMEVEG